MPLDNIPSSDMSDPGNPAPRPVGADMQPDLKLTHAIYYDTSSPMDIAGSYHHRYGAWPREIIYPPEAQFTHNEAAQSWLDAHAIKVIVSTRAKHLAYAGPVPAI